MCILTLCTTGKGKGKQMDVLEVDSILRDSINQLYDSIDSLYSTLEETYTQRDFFKDKYIMSVMKGYQSDKDYLDSAFSAIDTISLSDIEEKYIPCPDNPDFAKIMDDINRVRKNRQLYEKACYLISENGPDYYPGLTDTIMSVIDSISGPLSASQDIEIEDLTYLVNMYPDAVLKLQSTITFVVAQLDRKGAGENDEFKKYVQNNLSDYLDTPRLKNDYNFRISRIPRLDYIYKEWTEELKKDILSLRAIEIENSVLPPESEENPEE